MNDVATPPQQRAWRSWMNFFREPLRRVEAESRAFLASEAGRRPDRKVILILVSAALCLTAQRFVAMQDGVADIAAWLDASGPPELARRFRLLMWDAEGAQLNRLAWWAAVSLLTYVAVPGLIVRLVFKERLRDYGVKVGGVFADAWVYGLMMAVAWPAIFLASNSEHFQATYPFYHLASGEGAGPNLLCWELLYAAQFFGVEFFFRGYLVHGLKYRFGAYAIFVMVVPYCMLHFYKPLPEALASVLGGVVLGFMSLRTRSIWMGTAIHVTVAWSMDAASLWRQGFFSG
jgi:membrane protease YdiL (CAAX protease family)